MFPTVYEVALHLFPEIFSSFSKTRIMSSLLYGLLRKHNASPTTDNGAEGTVVEPLYTKGKTTLGNPLDFPLSLVSRLDVKSYFQDSKRVEDSLKNIKVFLRNY